MVAVVYNKETKRVLKRYYTYKGALTAHTRAANRAHTGRPGKIGGVTIDTATLKNLMVMTEDYYLEYCNPTVIVTNLMTGQPVKIRESERGTVCDPSTERYWSM